MGPRWVVSVCLTLAATVACACTSSSAGPRPRRSAQPVPTSTSSGRAAAGVETLSLAGWATVRVPRRWIVTRFMGVPATVYFPLDFVSSRPLPAACRGGASPFSCAGPNWFAPSWTTPDRGVLILWARSEFPGRGPALANLPGHRVRIDHHAAKLYSGPATSSCPPGTRSEIDAFVHAAGPAYPGERIDMDACFGANVAQADRARVRAMLASLRIRTD